MELDDAPQQKRQVDTSNRDARLAVAETLSLFPAWRSDLARLSAHAERRFSQAERQRMLARCAAIDGELMKARTSLLTDLADAPRKVASNSRVADVGRALDNIETAVAELRAKLGS